MDSNTPLSTGGLFNAAFDSIDTVVPFDAGWNNGTGYFNGAVEQVKLDNGVVGKSYCADTDRKLILIGTIFGTCVFFQRFTGGGDVIVSNVPHEVYLLKLQQLPNGRIGTDQLRSLLDISYETPISLGEYNLAYTLNQMQGIFKTAVSTDAV